MIKLTRLRRWLAGRMLDAQDRAALNALHDRDPNPKPMKYTFETTFDSVSEHARNISENIRGTHRPAIFLHAVMPRSGSVHTGNLIGLHPDVHSYARDIWELPFLAASPHLTAFQSAFFETYSKNDHKLGRNDFLTLFGAATMRYLLADVSADKTLLMKDPRIDQLELFPIAFPNEYLVLLVRDGRDVVNSTMKSWPDHSFEAVCQTWNSKAQRALDLLQKFGGSTTKNLSENPVGPAPSPQPTCKGRGSYSDFRIDSRSESPNRFLMLRFEDIVQNPGREMQKLCQSFVLPPDRFPLDAIGGLPVQGSSEYQPAGVVDWQHREAKPGFNPIARWRNWNSSRKTCFKRIAGQALIDLGYANNNDW